jgi:hypothetical protein
MKYAKLLLLLGISLSLSSNGQGVEGGQHLNAPSLPIDVSKPFVYIEVDHVGPRKPLRESEPNEGIFFHLKNNCQVPIVVITLKVSTALTGPVIGVEDEVVPSPQQDGADRGIEVVHYQPGEESLTDIFLSPNMDEAEVDTAIAESKSQHSDVDRRELDNRPHGYNRGYLPGVPVLAVVPPGGEIPFSVPFNHVGKTWHFEVPFRFALKHEGPIRQPYSFVAFFWDDLPEAYRSGSTESPAPKSASPASTLLHESGHVNPPKPE